MNEAVTIPLREPPISSPSIVARPVKIAEPVAGVTISVAARPDFNYS